MPKLSMRRSESWDGEEQLGINYKFWQYFTPLSQCLVLQSLLVFFVENSELVFFEYLPPANEVTGKAMFLHLSVSHSVLLGREGCLPVGPGRVPVFGSGGVHPLYTPLDNPSGHTQPWTHTPLNTHTHTHTGNTHKPLDTQTPWTHTPLLEMAIEAGSMHPTGMHSCFDMIFCYCWRRGLSWQCHCTTPGVHLSFTSSSFIAILCSSCTLKPFIIW